MGVARRNAVLFAGALMVAGSVASAGPTGNPRALFTDQEWRELTALRGAAAVILPGVVPAGYKVSNVRTEIDAGAHPATLTYDVEFKGPCMPNPRYPQFPQCSTIHWHGSTRDDSAVRASGGGGGDPDPASFSGPSSAPYRSPILGNGTVTREQQSATCFSTSPDRGQAYVWYAATNVARTGIVLDSCSLGPEDLARMMESATLESR